MAYYRQVGAVPPKRHIRFRQDDGTLFHQELVVAEGFSADSSLVYHRAPTTTPTSTATK